MNITVTPKPQKCPLLDENGLLIRTFFTFDQMMAVCNSRLWAEKPLLLDQIGPQNEETIEIEDNSAVQFLNGAFDLAILLQNATQRELMLLPAMGYAENDPHSLTRLSFLLKGLQQELTEYCDFCMEFSDDEFFEGILAELEMCLGIQEHWRNVEMDLDDENTEGGMEEEEREQAIEAELEQLWRMNLPPEEPPPERLTLPARPPPASSPTLPFPLGRHFSTGQHIYPYNYQQKEASSIPNSPTPKNALKTTFFLPKNAEREKDKDKGQSRNLFSESTDSRGGMRKKRGEKGQKQQNVMIGGEDEKQQQILTMLVAANQRSTSVPLLWANEIKAKMGKMNNRPQQMMDGMQKRLEQKRASIGGQKTPKILGELLPIEEPKKKLSASSTSTMMNESNSICSLRNSSQQKCQQQKMMQKTFRIYAKRLNEWRIVIYVMAKDARVCRTLMAKTMQNTFPVMAFFCDKPKMAQYFVENMADGQLRPMEPWIVENFSIKSELSTLANLQRQIQRRENLGEKRAFGGTKGELDAFYLIGCFAAANARIIEMDFGELASQYLPQFDLVDHCENVFEEFLFTKAFIGTIYTCLGQQLFVPSNILSEALDYCCEHTNIEIGLINEILKDTCSHLSNKEEDGQQIILPSKMHHRHSSVSSISSFSSSSSSSSSSSNISPSKRSLGFGVSSSMGGRSSGEDTLVMAEQPPIGTKTSFIGQNCADQLDDFRNSFEQLLRRHNFHRIPGLPDYFFYWPQNQQEHSLSSFNLPGLEDYIQITLPTEFSPPQSAHFSQTEPKMNAFSRHSSARNTGKERRTRKASASAESIAGGKKQNLTETMRRETEEQTEMGSIQSRCSGSSSTSWEQRDEEDEADSEKSSLAGELLSEHWPLFIQFYVVIQQQSSDQKENCPIEFIPNCLKQIFDRHSNFRRINLGERSKHFRLGQLKISIDMYILTWPLPSHCPFEEQQQQLRDEDSSMVVAEYVRPLEEEKEKGNVAELEELFGESDGAEWIQKRKAAKGINQQQSGDEIFERKVEMLRQIPTEERRMLRRLQRNVQKMLKTEHILITSRAFSSKQDIGTLLRVVQFIREEVDGREATNARTGTEQTVARFEMCNKELVFVTEPEDGLRRLAAKLEGIQVEYCQLKQMPKNEGECPFELESMMDSTKMLCYSCGVENLEGFVRTRHESIKQIGKTFKRVLNNRSVQKRRMEREEEEEENGEEVINSEGGGGLIEEEEKEEEKEKEEAFCNSSTTAEEGATIAELTMPLNDLDEKNILHPNDLTLRHIQKAINAGKDDLIGNTGTSLVERKQLLHDFWLIIQIEAGGGDSLLAVNIYFCQRTFLLHDQLFENACRTVDEQIRLVNQELLLEKMHQTEECDQLLLDHDNRQIGGIGLDSVRQSNAATRSAQNVPGEALSRHSSKFAQNRPISLLLEEEQPEAAKFRQIAVPIHERNNSLTFSDEDEHSEVSELARYKFMPGHFACQMVWHQWFPIHPRLKSCDIGFKALRLGLEGLAVRNRSNMYVYKEQNGNVVYMRLHCTEESVLANIPANGGPWEEEVRQYCPQCILLAVHGVRTPGEEITVQLRSVLQRRLNSRTLEEIQNALLKNAHIRLEWNDIKFIQKDPDKPFSIFFFTIPQIAQRHLGSVKYYLSQQMLTFCISPKFREQSGVHHYSHGRAKYSGSGNNGSRYFSGGDTSLALSLAGTPTIEQQPPPPSSLQQFRIDSREMVPLHSFVPYAIPNMAQNPTNYLPTFYLVNKPPGEGKRDTGIACLEVKLIDWEGKLMEQTEEGRLDAQSHSLLYPGVLSAINPLQRMARLHELSKCIQVENPFECAQMAGICALFQFNMWQNGNIGVEELQGRLKMCVQQAVCDLVTEFGLLSSTLFDNCPSPVRSKAGSFSVANTSLGFVQQQPNSNKPCPSELPIPHSLIDSSNSSSSIPPPIQSSPVKAFQQPSLDPPFNNPLAVKSDAIFHPQPLRYPVIVPLLNRPNQRPLQSPVQFANAPPPQQKILFHQENTGELLRADFVIAADDWFSHVINETKGSPEMSHSVRKYQFRLDCDASAKKIIQIVHDRLKMVLKTERVVICRGTMNETTFANRKRLQTIRSLTSLLEPTERDLGRRVANNGEEEPLEMALLAFNEQFDHRMVQIGAQQQQIDLVGIVQAAKIAEQTSPERGRLANNHQNKVMMVDGNGPEGGRRATMMSQQREMIKNERMNEEEEMRIWRNSMEPMQAFARRMSCVSSLGCWRSGTGANHHLILRSITPTPNDHPMAGGGGPPSPTATSSLSKFLPCLKPFIPRQRLLYLTIRGETINLFLYNYTNEVVAKTREIVERATLWHNARSRLLREIGLHKMGITHLSTLKSEDAKYNSYLLLTWMDPETLIDNEYPVDSLTTPDFSNIPRIYAQLLLKLYRFADPEFVAKHISLNPFEDQTQQMLALREDIRSMLNDHRLYMEVHKELIDKKELNMSEEMLSRLISHCHLVHFVQSPLLLLPSWRRKVATIRGGIVPTDFDIPCRKHSFQSSIPHQLGANGKAKTTKNQFPIGPSNNPSPHRCSSSAKSTEDEPCSGRIQQMLLEDYTNYLRSIGLCLLQIEKMPESSSHLFAPIAATRHPSGLPNVASAPSQSQSSPEHWLYFALDGGIIFIHLSFIAPYFCIRILQWNAQPQLDEHLRPSQQKRGSGTHLNQQHSLRLLEHQKNELVRRCHLHSFVYDFHLRMVARYLVGEPHFVLFNPGYNINAFLVDFLQYYGCRPPNARNCVYEETICCADLKSSQNSIWEHFLNNEQIFGWKVIRLKSQEEGGDEFMLVATERRKAFGLDYELVRVIIKGGNVQKEHQITLRLYVLLVTKMMAPFESMPTLESSKSKLDQIGDEIERKKALFAPDGGEFTQILVPNAALGRGIGEQQIVDKNASQIELESFGEVEEDEDEDKNEGNEAKECRVIDHHEGTKTQSLLPSSIFGPIHHRQHSASSTTSQRVQSNNCYECVIAAELGENNQKGKSRKRFCSGGLLINGGGLGRRNVAARMSLPPSRTNTNSSSTSSRLRQRSDSSQLSIGSLLMNSPTKKGEGGSTTTKTLTSANSLKGLSEWRANEPKEEKEGIVDWSILADVEMERKNLAIQRNPPRRHRKGQSQGNSFCLMAERIGREKGAIVPPEQVTYLHYLSSHQRRLQHLLEEEVRTNQLTQFVKEADQFCYVDSLWKCVLTSRSFQISSQKAQSLFLSSNSSKSDILSEATFFGRSSNPSSDLEHFDFEALLRVIGVESAVEKEPKVRELLNRVNWSKLCRFLVQLYESERRCRFFECQQYSYLVIINPQFLDSAAMFRHNSPNACTELFLLFKQSSHKFDTHIDSFTSNSVRKLFEEVISCLCAFQWSNLLQNPPNLM